jgi:hypothetical protein
LQQQVFFPASNVLTVLFCIIVHESRVNANQSERYKTSITCGTVWLIDQYSSS